MSDDSSNKNNLSDFMSLRLLLLRAPGKRSTQENELIEILKSSYQSYAKTGRRSSNELANLIVKDWICLKATYGLVSPAGSAKSPPGPLAEPLSHPPARRLSSMEAPQRRHSAGSLPPAFQSINQPMNQSPNLQPANQSQSLRPMSQPPVGILKPPLKPMLGQSQANFSSVGFQQQMAYVNYGLAQTSSSFANQQSSMLNTGLSMPSPSNASIISSSTNGSTNSLNHLPRAPKFQPRQSMQTPSSDSVSQQ